MKRILILGSNGDIGSILSKSLSKNNFIIESDLSKHSKNNTENQYIKIDVTNYSDFFKKCPEPIDIIINLTGLREMRNIPDINEMNQMIDLYIKGCYNVYQIAVEKKINKVIFASSNHVTDFYEQNGYSLLNREINADDFPKTNSVYGAFKFFGESLGFIFHQNKQLSIICFRIGTVRKTDEETINLNDRSKRTALLHKDLINMFNNAIDNNTIEFGVYYAVSNNIDKPWSIKNYITELLP